MFTLTLCAQSPITAGRDSETGQIQGIVTSVSGKAGIPQITVNAFLPGATPAFSKSAVTGSKGTFSLTGLRGGAYSVCVSGKQNAWVDQCHWPDLYSTVVVSEGQIVSGLDLQLRDSSVINIRVDDSGQLLTSKSPAIAAPQVNAGVFDLRGIFHPASELKKDATGISFQLAVPAGLPMRVSVNSANVALETDQHIPVPSGGVAAGVIQKQPQARTFTFNAVSVK